MSTKQSSRREWLVIGGLVALSLVPAIAGTARLGSLASGAEVTPENARFFAMPLPVVLHVLGAVPFSLLGAFQFGAGFRRRHRKFHRAAGKILASCGMMVAVSGLWMTLAYPWANNDGIAVYVMRLMFGLGMVYSIVAGVEAIVRRRDLDAHGAWMVRAYAIGMGAGTQVFTHLPWFIFMGVAPSEFPRAVMMGAGWVINLLVAEVVIRRGSRRSKKVAVVPMVAAHSA